MNRAELITAVAERSGVSQSDADAVLGAFGDVLLEAVAKGDAVKLPGLMTVERVERAARTGRNPRTGETLEIAASFGAKLTAGSKLKAAAAGS
ncbi:HU family DNA-binding protein [Paenibacillus sp. TRM 82003]|uniref:HU family DNA-binding protein n=1 Tax=unclassified Kineococcus TaxID=2621656 RepID=UPI001F58EB94|nr:HU family DNA-binding protein [Kineococcus sp. TRM81007]MCI2240131.1 HU family DNA-binding protein [Kineococcus sp. TRM81007]MCI3925563.1 HU family DNA-binding protein [Paenibacillus sp. TRM 82003]